MRNVRFNLKDSSCADCFQDEIMQKLGHEVDDKYFSVITQLIQHISNKSPDYQESVMLAATDAFSVPLHSCILLSIYVCIVYTT